MIPVGDKQKQKQERARKRAICETCPHLLKSLIKTCGLCGCVVALKTISGKCPDNKW